jgi:hypothetical protein
MDTTMTNGEKIEIKHITFGDTDTFGEYLRIITPRRLLDIRVTPSGLIRVGKPRKRGDHENVLGYGENE